MGHPLAPLVWTPEIVAEFAPSIAANPWRFGTAAEVLDGSYVYEITSGEKRALIAVRPVQRQQGTRLDVVALVSTGNRLDADLMRDSVHEIATSFNATLLGMATQIDHVAHVAKRAGWKQAGILMIKPMGPIQ